MDAAATAASEGKHEEPGRLYSVPVVTIAGDPATLAPYRGQTLLIVNVASRCGFTPQYAGLEEMYRRYKSRGFAVLGFPCDQFGNQEPGTEAEIGRASCREGAEMQVDR